MGLGKDILLAQETTGGDGIIISDNENEVRDPILLEQST